MVEISRRAVIGSAGAAALCAPFASRARAAALFPEKNITFIVPYGPGGGFDTFARAISPAMERYLPNKVEILPINVGTAGGGRALAQLYRTRPDGHTIGVFPIPGALILQEQQGARDFDLYKFTWLGRIGPGDKYALAVKADSPIQSVADLQRLSQEREVTFTTTGPDGTSYMANVISNHLLGIRAKYITGYSGSSEYIVAAMRGDGDATVAVVSTLKRFQGQGVRVIASFEAESTIEGVPGANALGQPELDQITIDRMVAAPPGLPEDIKTALTSALDAAVRDPEVVEWARSVDIPWFPNPPGQADAMFLGQAAFFDKWKPYLIGR